VLVEGGDFFAREREQGEATSRLVWSNLEALKFDAVALGEGELSQLDLLQQLMEKTPLPVVATNVEVLRNGVFVPLAAPYHIATMNGVKVGFLSLISENEASPAALGTMATDVRILPPAETAARVARELRKQVDLIVLLAHVDNKTMEEYASALPEVDMVVGGHVTIKDEGPIPIGHVVVNRSGTRGQNLCSTRMIVSPLGQVVDFGGINVTLGPAFREDSTVLAQVTQVKEAENRMRQEKMAAMREKMELKAKERQAAGEQTAPAADQKLPDPPVTPPPPVQQR
jgi:2',3'-cyclic-nucleotide 2'-phosphodiesterase (5'-nucleotidase family)